MRAVKLESVVPENRRLSLIVPPEIPNGPVEVLILAKDVSEARQGALLSFLDDLVEVPASRSAEVIEAAVAAERNAWDE